MKAGGSAVVVALVATYRRPQEIRRLGECLSRQTHPVAGIVVVDNANDPTTRETVSTLPVKSTYLAAASNLGCGAGLRLAEEHLLERAASVEPTPTHWWILDDDVAPPPETLALLLEALAGAGAGMAVPLLTDHEGKIWGFPEPRQLGLRRLFRRTSDPVAVARACGSSAHPCLWTTGACQLVSVAAVSKAGLHRTDFWMLGEDLDFSMRVAQVEGAVFRGDVAVPHLPPESPGSNSRRGYAKFCALLQNLTYLAYWNRGSAHLWRYLPGNYRRFFRTEGWGWAALRDAGDCFLSGCCGIPAGCGAGVRVRNRLAESSGGEAVK
ncbi:MAG: glycosyltransferase [Candidatus Methylacidiphilales bacterium]|nr:glycosyltransferase [Candidatus Methylacidiphilales bacterium]